MHRNSNTYHRISISARGLRLPLWRSVLALLLFGWCLGATASTFQLEPNRWESLVIPANPDGHTVAELLGDDLPADAVFGTDWAVYTYNAQIADYNRPANLDEVLVQGRAFWIIQLTDEPVTLDIPDDLPVGDHAQSAACVSADGCFEISLPADPSMPAGTLGQRFDFLGAPFSLASNLADARIQTDVDGDACEPGCDLDQATAEAYTLDHVWIWDDSINTYLKPGVGDTVNPWQGYWMVALQAVEGKSPQLLLPYTAPLATVAGRVTTPDGQPVTGASVLASSNGSSDVALTDNNGDFGLSLPASSGYTLSIASDEHTNQVRVIRTPVQGQTLQLDLTLLQTDYTTTFDAQADIEITAPNGASVELPGDNFVNANGQPVTGTIELSMTSVDVSNPATLAAFPGNFDGIDSSATPTPIVSLGTTHFAFTQGGQPVQLDSNADANISIPIFSDTYQNGSPVTAGDTIPLWSLDEASGIWQQEGSGMVVAEAASPTGLVLQASVTHFSWWNCDVTMNAVQVRIAVQGSGQGSAVISAVAGGDLGWRPNSVDTLTSIGLRTPPLYVPSGREVCYSAAVTYLDGATATTDQQCLSLPAGSPVTDIDLTAPDPTTTLSIATNIGPDNRNPVVNGYIGGPIRRLQLLPFSIESNVSYAVSGALPTGLELQPLHATGAEITGVPTTAGTYDVQITATNAQNETDSLTVRYVIDSGTPAPLLPAPITALINANFEDNSYDFSIDNVGGPVVHWDLIENSQALPTGMQFDTETGIVSIPYDLLFSTPPEVWYWTGQIEAFGVVGESIADVTIEVLCDFCFPGFGSAGGQGR